MNFKLIFLLKRKILIVAKFGGLAYIIKNFVLRLNVKIITFVCTYLLTFTLSSALFQRGCFVSPQISFSQNIADLRVLHPLRSFSFHHRSRLSDTNVDSSFLVK